jgi:hypothetical protein
MYAMSATGLIYEENANMGAVINSKPNTHLLAVSVLNDLSATQPGTTSTLRAEVSIGQAISTDLSTFLFTLHDPFTFSTGSIPTAVESSSYATNPIALYAAPLIKSYVILTPHIFMLTFNEKFVVGRRFIVQINQINNPFAIQASNISIYTLDYNTLIPLEAFEGLYPIATASYTLTMALGLPYNAPFQGAMQFYQYSNNYIQLSIQIPYSVPEGYTIRIVLTSATFYEGTAYANFQSLTYTPVYDYSVTNTVLLISGMGPIVVGTTFTVTALIYLNTNSLFIVKSYLDTPAVIAAFSSSRYLYEGIVDGSGITKDSFFDAFYDSTFNTAWRVMYADSYGTGQWLYLRIYQAISSTATSSGSYVEFYLPPTVQVSPSFDPTNDCRFDNNLNSCNIVFVQTATYLKVTVKAIGTYAAGKSNPFPYQSYTYIYLQNILFPQATTNRVIYPIYVTLYKADIVNPPAYRSAEFLGVDPREGTLSGLSLLYLGNYATSTPANYQTYPGALRLSSSTPSQMNLVVQPNE